MLRECEHLHIPSVSMHLSSIATRKRITWFSRLFPSCWFCREDLHEVEVRKQLSCFRLSRFVVEDFGQLQVGIVSPTMRTSQLVDCLECFPMRLIQYPPRPVWQKYGIFRSKRSILRVNSLNCLALHLLDLGILWDQVWCLRLSDGFICVSCAFLGWVCDSNGDDRGKTDDGFHFDL